MLHDGSSAFVARLNVVTMQRRQPLGFLMFYEQRREQHGSMLRVWGIGFADDGYVAYEVQAWLHDNAPDRVYLFNPKPFPEWPI